jgi:hypothetical protein
MCGGALPHGHHLVLFISLLLILLCGKLYIGFKITFLSFLHREDHPPAIPLNGCKATQTVRYITVSFLFFTGGRPPGPPLPPPELFLGYANHMYHILLQFKRNSNFPHLLHP